MTDKKPAVEEHDQRCAVVRSGDLRAWCDCGQSMAGDNPLAEQLRTVLQREADSQRRHDEKVERLEAKIERLRRVLARWRYSGCPNCSGDCGSANPPVMCCIMEETRAALGETK